MVKGISRQVIVLQSPDPKLFEQAIFILKDDALRDGITDEILLKEARKAIRGDADRFHKKHFYLCDAVWAVGGALTMGLVWLATAFL